MARAVAAATRKSDGLPFDDRSRIINDGRHRQQGALGPQVWEGLPSLTVPDPFFVSSYERLVDRLFPNAGMALDLAAGLGRHALWLADRGWQVNAVDISEVAIGKLSQAAVNTISQSNSLQWTPQNTSFDRSSSI